VKPASVVISCQSVVIAAVFLLLNFNRGRPVVFEFKSETEYFKVTVKIQQCVIYTNTNIHTLLCFDGKIKKKKKFYF